MRNISRLADLLLVCYALLVLAQNPAAQLAAKTTATDQNSMNLYDAFGYQKRGTILDWGFSALVTTTAKPFSLIPAIAPMALSTTSRPWVWTSTRWISPCSHTATLTTFRASTTC